MWIHAITSVIRCVTVCSAEFFDLVRKINVVTTSVRRRKVYPKTLLLVRRVFLIIYISTVLSGPHAGCGVVRIDPLRFLAGCHKR